MQFAEAAHDRLGAELQRSRAAGMQPVRPPRHDLQAAGRRRRAPAAEPWRRPWRRRRRRCLAGAAQMRPGPRRGEAAPHAGGGEFSGPFRRRSSEDLARPRTARNRQSRARRCGRSAAIEPRQQARAHVGKIGGDRVGERQRRIAAAKAARLLVRDEGPGDGLDQPLRRQRPPRRARALLHRRQHRARDALGARERRRDDVVDAEDAQDFLDDIGLALDVRPPCRRGYFRAALGGGRDRKAEPRQNRGRFVRRDVEAGEALRFAEREIDDARRASAPRPRQ